jgi:hypothetical protein
MVRGSAKRLFQIKDLSTANIVSAILGSLLLAFFSPDRPLFILGSFVIIFLTSLFYAKMLPPVLLMSAFFQWFFYHGKLFDGLARGESVVNLNYYSLTKPDVIVLGFIATVCFFLGVYVIVRRVRVPSEESVRAFCLSVNLDRLVSIYMSVYVVLFVAGNFIWYFPGLSQPLYILTLFRWSLFFLLFISVFYQNRFKNLLLFLILVDVAVGFFSFFSNFKEVIYFSFIAYWSFIFKSSAKSMLIAVGVIVLTFVLGVYWTAIKKDYREFLNQGTGGQVVLTSRSESYSRLLNLVSEVDDARFERSFEELLERLSWIGAFDGVYKRVPDRVPHEEGALWLAGITRPFMPRLFFPDKKVLADSKELNKYSALKVEEKNTSISLSMVAGSYVDFGKFGMHLPLFLFGIFCGWVYTRAVKWGRHIVVGYALTMPMLYLLQVNEQSINRMVSAMFLYLIALWFIQRFLLVEFLAVILPQHQLDSHRGKISGKIVDAGPASSL